MLDVILPVIDNSEDLTEGRLHGLMRFVDEIRRERRYGTETKYTQQYFADLWGFDHPDDE